MTAETILHLFVSFEIIFRLITETKVILLQNR